MTLEQAQLVVQKYVEPWNRSIGRIPLWVYLAKPGGSINIPGVTFGMTADPEKIAGMHYHLHAYLIVLREGMLPESIVTTFFHEYGHAQYELGHAVVDIIESEVAAIRSSLELCVVEGIEELAYREAEAVRAMAVDEPYRSAVERLKGDALWRKYSKKD
jgi:hypothetical protein